MTTDRERDDQRTALLIAADTALTSAERTQFLARFPSQRGAHVADILDILDDTDSDLGVIEPMCQAHPQDVPEPGLLRAAIYLCLYLGDVHSLTSDKVTTMIDRIRPLLALDKWELRDERMKRDKLELLAPLGFVDANDGEFPSDIYHPAFGSVSHGSISLANVVTLAVTRGHEVGADKLRAQFRALLDVAPAPRPED